MRKFPVLTGRYKGKAVEVPYYLKTNHGVELKLVHDIRTGAGRSLRWVQTVHENGEISKRCGRSTYVDPLVPPRKPGSEAGKGGKQIKGVKPVRGTTEVNEIKEVCRPGNTGPFYDSEKQHVSRGSSFYDSPQERAPKNGRLWVRFTTSLVEVVGTRIELLVTLYWGYDRTKWKLGDPESGRIGMVKLRRATDDEVRWHLRVLKRDFPAWTYHAGG
jgi:hypothetical protein